MLVRHHPVQIYYEDTDHSGFVYHANYLRFFERGREHYIGVAELVRLLREEGVGFVVYRAEIDYKEPALFGDSLLVRSRAELKSDYRVLFHQDLVRTEDGPALVAGKLTLVCIDGKRQLVPIPGAFAEWLRAGAP